MINPNSLHRVTGVLTVGPVNGRLGTTYITRKDGTMFQVWDDLPKHWTTGDVVTCEVNYSITAERYLPYRGTLRRLKVVNKVTI